MVAVGPGGRDRAGNLIPVTVKEGDSVLLPEFGGTQVKLGEKEYVLLSILVSFSLFCLLLCCCMFKYLLGFSCFWFLVCGFCCAGSFCIGMRISWALFMTDWILASNGVLFGFGRSYGFIGFSSDY